MNKNIWLLFYTIIVIGTALLLTASYIKYNALLEETKIEQLTLTESYQYHIHTSLSQYEAIHNLMAEQFQQDEFNPNHLSTIKAQEDRLYSMAIYSIEGSLLKNSKTFSEQVEKAPQFSKAINQSTLVVGQIFYDHQANKWLTPLYQRIEEPANNVIAISVSLLDTALLNQHWQSIKHTNKGQTLQVKLADTQRSVFSSNIQPQQYHQYYSAAPIIAAPKHKALINTVNDRCGIKSPLSSERVSTTIYDHYYQLCFSASTPVSDIKSHLLYPFVAYCFLYLILIGSTFFFIKWINRVATTKVNALTYEAEHDPLTGLANGQALEAYYLHAKKNSTAFSLLYLDLDKFKSINDSFGHSCGDKILLEVATRIERSIKLYNGTAIRYSGDEFVLLVKSDDKELLQHCATHLLDTVSQPYLIGQNAFRVSSSIGIACYPEDASDIETLLSYADNSMYVAKKTNAPCLFFSKSTHQQLTQRVEIEQALHHAIERQEISVVYQPQVNGDNTLSGVEALVRWDSADLGVIAPDTFIPIAEECGMMPKLGLYIMHKAMEEITQLQQSINQNFTLSINVSVRQFIKLDFIDKFLNALTKYTKINPNLAVSIEITESLFIESVESLLPLFHKLKHHHVTLSLDDFGTGYSSLSLLRDLPIDELKIDKSFVDYITTNPTDKAMVESIIGMGKKLGLSVLTEGVEDRQQADILLAAGCDLFQGYFFSRPLSVKDLETYCLQQPKVTLIARNRVMI